MSVHVCNGWILQCAAWSIIHSTNFMRGMDSNCQIREICTSAYMLSNSIQPFVHQPANDFQTCKPNRTMTSERAVSFVRTVAWHVNVVIVCWLAGFANNVYETYLSFIILLPHFCCCCFLHTHFWASGWSLCKVALSNSLISLSLHACLLFKYCLNA